MKCKEEVGQNPSGTLPPKFFIKMLTEPNDLVVDPFPGSIITGAVADKMNRRLLAGEAVERSALSRAKRTLNYLEGDARERSG